MHFFNTASTAWRERGAVQPDLTWRGRLASLRNVWPLFRMLWQTSPRLLTATVSLRISRALLAVVALWIPKLILDAIVVAVSTGQANPSRLWTLVGVELVLTIGSDVAARANVLADSLLADRFTSRVSVDVIRHAARLDLVTFESPRFYDILERARNQSSSRIGMISAVLCLLQDAVSLLAFTGGLIVFAPWLGLVVVCAMTPSVLSETHHAALSYSALFRSTPYRRLLDYLRYLGASAESAKEVKLFGLGQYVSEMYTAVAAHVYGETRELAVRRAASGSILNVLALLAYYSGYLFILSRALAGRASLGTFALLVTSLARVRFHADRVVTEIVEICEQAIYLRDLVAFFDVTPSIRSAQDAVPAPRTVRRGFEARDVSFSYPGSRRDALRHVSFALGPGETLALVGDNGAGKTTLIKLLLRLYDPTSGCILLDGIDLREYDVDDLRRTAGVLFQDYMRYEMRVRDNIAFGNLDILDDPARLAAAACQGGAGPLIDRLPGGFDQILGHRFEGAMAVSAGEWQKLALARAHARGAQLLILDEPASHLDAQAESDLFRRLAATADERMTVLISHRFSTVRLANHILVLDKGEILERGTHGELMRLGRRYAESFNLQAGAYQ